MSFYIRSSLLLTTVKYHPDKNPGNKEAEEKVCACFEQFYDTIAIYKLNEVHPHSHNHIHLHTHSHSRAYSYNSLKVHQQQHHQQQQRHSHNHSN